MPFSIPSARGMWGSPPVGQPGGGAVPPPPPPVGGRCVYVFEVDSCSSSSDSLLGTGVSDCVGSGGRVSD